MNGTRWNASLPSPKTGSWKGPGSGATGCAPTLTAARLPDLSTPAEGGYQEEGDQCPGEDQAPHARAAVLVKDDAQQTQHKAERRRDNDSQPAKGCNGRPSARTAQQHGGQCDQRGQRDAQADSAQTDLVARQRLGLDDGGFFHKQALRAGPRPACWTLPAG